MVGGTGTSNSSSSSSDDETDYNHRCIGGPDVGEWESCISFSCRRFSAAGGGGGDQLASLFSPSASPVPASSDFPEVFGGKSIALWSEEKDQREKDLSEVEMMKERFAKLLLGEDMSGSGKGVCTALAISNAITNLSATVFGELWRLEPLAPQKKSIWFREMDWLLTVSDYIVDLVPMIQQFPGGGTYEVMATRPRSDLYMNLPALKKIDAMLISMLDKFCETEFWYVDRGIVVGDNDDCGHILVSPYDERSYSRQQEKWWLPCPKVPAKGLSEASRKRLQQCRDCTNQILKAAMAINSNVLAEMEVPTAYLETLPKSGKACLGDFMYRELASETFSSDRLLDCLDISSEHQTLEIANMIEAAIHVWKHRDHKKLSNNAEVRHSSWGNMVRGLVAADKDKHGLLIERAETLLQTLKLRFPNLPQTALDMNKIQYNKDVGQAILESYSRVMESLAFNVMARIDDVLHVDDITKQRAAMESSPLFTRGGLGCLPIQKRMCPSPFSIHHTPYGSPFGTPTFYSSTPVSGSPPKVLPSMNENPKGASETRSVSRNIEKLWSYAGKLSSERTSNDAPERD